MLLERINGHSAIRSPLQPQLPIGEDRTLRLHLGMPGGAPAREGREGRAVGREPGDG